MPGNHPLKDANLVLFFQERLLRQTGGLRTVSIDFLRKLLYIGVGDLSRAALMKSVLQKRI